MTVQKRLNAAKAILKIVRANCSPPIENRLRVHLRRFVMQAHFMGLRPEDVLHPNGRAAFEAVAQSIGKPVFRELCSEWRMVEDLARKMFLPPQGTHAS